MATVALADAAIHVEEAGAGPPLVLLHGLGASGAEWAPQVEAFRGRYRVITPDARGSGRTVDRAHPRGPFAIATMARDLAAVLDHLGVARAHLCGWSLGGMIALQLAVDAPARVASLVVVNSGPDWTPRGALQRVALPLRGLVTALVGPRPMARALAPRLFPRPEHEALRRDYIERMGRQDKRAYAALLAAILEWSVADRLAALTMPTLAIASDRDYLGVARQEEWVRQVAGARLVVVEDARHALPIEDPARFNQVLGSFLDEVADQV